MRYLIAIGGGVLIWMILAQVIRGLLIPRDEPDPENVVDTNEHFKCSVCGTEVTMTVTSATEIDPPRHCREEMVAVWRPD